MLRITELRIGNLVSVLNKDEARVVTSLNVQKVRDGFYKTIGFGIDKDGFADSYLEELIYPIPLTEEWLIRCGYEGLDDFEDYQIYKKCEVKFLHQLQNVFFMSNWQELEIKNLNNQF